MSARQTSCIRTVIIPCVVLLLSCEPPGKTRKWVRNIRQFNLRVTHSASASSASAIQVNRAIITRIAYSFVLAVSLRALHHLAQIPGAAQRVSVGTAQRLPLLVQEHAD